MFIVFIVNRSFGTYLPRSYAFCADYKNPGEGEGAFYFAVTFLFHTFAISNTETLVKQIFRVSPTAKQGEALTFLSHHHYLFLIIL